MLTHDSHCRTADLLADSLNGISGEIDTCAIAFACDGTFAMPLATAIRSAVDAYRGREPLNIFVFTQDFAEEARRNVLCSFPAKSASISWKSVDLSSYQHFWQAAYISKMTFARLQMPDLIPHHISRVLYLDADLLVLGDIRQLMEVSLDGFVAGAVLDGVDRLIKADDPRVERVPRVRDYFNAGVLLVDIARWRQERISEKALAYLRNNPSSPFSDQDALNVACDGMWKPLDSRWNTQITSVKDISRLSPMQLSGIVHFVTSRKPWNPRIRHISARFYDSFRNRTQFARTPWGRFRDSVTMLTWQFLRSILHRLPILLNMTRYAKARTERNRV